MFEHFTEGSRAVLVEAQDLALELGSRHIDVGHLLYGCAEGREETAGRPLRDCGITGAFVRARVPRSDERTGAQPIDIDALSAIGIDYEGIAAVVDETFGPGALAAAPDRRGRPKSRRKPPFTADAKRSLQLALRVTVELQHRRIAPGHLLLGLMRLDDEFVATSLREAGTTIAALSGSVLSQLSETAA